MDAYPNAAFLSEQFKMISSQVSLVVLVWNSPPASLDFPDDAHKLRIIVNDSNIGLAGAQNQGIRVCLETGIERVLFLDQDSLPPADLVAALMSSEDVLTGQGFLVGAVGPLLIDAQSGDPWPFMRAGWIHTIGSTAADRHGACKADFLFSSGMLVSTRHFRSCGLFSEALFIDHVDLEWCYRATGTGLVFFGIPSVSMEHRVGEAVVRFLGRLHARHSAARDYFAFRNSVILIGMRHIPWRWKLNEIIRLLPRSFFYGLLNRSILLHLRALARGIADGIAYHTRQMKNRSAEMGTHD